MKRAALKCVRFFQCYHGLLAWGICAGVVWMTFFNVYIPGEWWLIVLLIGLFAEWGFALRRKHRYQMADQVRPFVIAAIIFSVLFAVFHFFFYLAETEGSMPEIVNGTYTLVNYDGKGIKEITEQEYHYFKCVEQRFWAGHIMAFYAVSMSFGLKRKERGDPLKQERI